MEYSIISLPFRLLYLVHACLFTFDVLLLSRRRARAPVAFGTAALLLGIPIYILITCNHLTLLHMNVSPLLSIGVKEQRSNTIKREGLPDHIVNNLCISPSGMLHDHASEPSTVNLCPFGVVHGPAPQNINAAFNICSAIHWPIAAGSIDHRGTRCKLLHTQGLPDLKGIMAGEDEASLVKQDFSGADGPALGSLGFKNRLGSVRNSHSKTDDVRLNVDEAYGDEGCEDVAASAVQTHNQGDHFSRTRRSALPVSRAPAASAYCDTSTACPDCFEFREQLTGQLRILAERFELFKAQLSACDCSFDRSAVITAAANEAAAAAVAASRLAGLAPDKVASASAIDIETAIQKAIRLYDADKTGRADYALESAGGEILSTRCTETYDTSLGRFYLFGFIPLFWKQPLPRWVIQPSLIAGKCWPFKGSIGYLVIKLSRRIRIEEFVLEHIPATLAPSGNIDSAPRDFQVFGLDELSDTEGVLLGNYSYSKDGEPLQHFIVKQNLKEATFQIVELRILTNHGNIRYTCLYRFRVHGSPVDVDDGVW